MEDVVCKQIVAQVTHSEEKIAKVESGIMRKYLTYPLKDYRSMDELRELAESTPAEINKCIHT